MGSKNLSDNGGYNSLNKQTTRRGFFRNLAGAWGGALKEAITHEEYPLKFKTLTYSTACTHTQAPFILSCTKTPLTFPEKLNHIRVFASSGVATSEGLKNLAALAKKMGSTHLIWDCDVMKPHTPPPWPAVVLNAEERFKTAAPTLFLFSQDQALTHGDSLGQIVQNQPHETDLYIGRIHDDLTDPESPTWQRLNLFFGQN